MLVYGDHHFTGQLHALRMRLLALAEQAHAAPENLERLRTLLTLCGQVEQGAHDTLTQRLPAAAAEPFIARFQQATAHAAAAFYSLAYQQPVLLPLPIISGEAALCKLLQTLGDLQTAPDLPLTVKVPEGFNLYALYPEQYLVAAGHWLADHPHQHAQSAVVVGIRSIGTTLAAVVSTVLRAAGWSMHTLTVRPTGHPYNRQVDLGATRFSPTALGLIVDEGPGLSGSSFAATAVALVAAGLQRENIAFLPGHANDPGGAGSAAVQQWWQTTPRYVADLAQVAFQGQPLQDALAALLPEPVSGVEEFSGGQWRRVLYADSTDWPAICTAFERIQYRYTLKSGRQLLGKFFGLASHSPALTTTTAAAATLLDERAKQGLVTSVVTTAYGFLISTWQTGTPLTSAAGTPALMARLGAYIARVAGPVLAEAEAHEAVARLREMLVVNTREALGEAAATAAQQLAPPCGTPEQRYGDGRLQPYTWLVDQAQCLHKTDSIGHNCDHTLVGDQAVLWDLAGAMVEWEVEEAALSSLLRAFTAAGDSMIDREHLIFYRAAYLAFRLGQCTMAAQVHDPYERDRLLLASASYRRQLATLLALDPALLPPSEPVTG